ncbi:MAG: Zn-ribbon domain-containing OB-fold protein [Thermoplasmata archaeon]|nr:Zn-ribbon domain-containing OB-fold protein [Candidatus Sysuiplasma acidicola]MBX8637729.1 Zn-ribbon domain-containing OB-fold protein [Candidatus Sysuiplasma acidicola]MBX8646599.1 Zn-ribbon domain-containing OB-fold protein [Candidatus Sysuiplasma acidicola]MDH2906416.1 Zn-ribbon domain-containing OB-fold protein [Methanomassiliicoccales archaeon]
MSNPRYWRENPSRYTLLGSSCGNCNETFFPPRAICPKCRRKSVGKITPRKLSGKGKVYSYTLVHEPMPDFTLMRPYIMAIVEMEEGVRVTSQIVDCREEDVRIGMKVEAIFRRLGEEGSAGIIRYGYKFRPAV